MRARIVFILAGIGLFCIPAAGMAQMRIMRVGGGEDAAARAEAEFRKLDVNGDGLLDTEEMDDVLKAERKKWDRNEDGFIDLAEYKRYFRARQRQENAQVAQLLEGMSIKIVQRENPEHKPEEKKDKKDAQPDPGLPPNLPPWFKQYDTNGDGQIALHEWKAAGQPIAKFLEMDTNGDGLLTADEVLWALGLKAKEPQE